MALFQTFLDLYKEMYFLAGYDNPTQELYERRIIDMIMMIRRDKLSHVNATEIGSLDKKIVKIFGKWMTKYHPSWSVNLTFDVILSRGKYQFENSDWKFSQ